MIRAFATASMVVVLARTAQPAPGERDELDACNAMIERAAAIATARRRPGRCRGSQKCRQIVKEWTLRDSRMSVDENGRPLR